MDPQGAGMAGSHRPALTVGGGAGGAAIGRDVADRERLAAMLGGGFYDGHGRRVGLMWAGRQGRWSRPRGDFTATESRSGSRQLAINPAGNTGHSHRTA